MCVCVCGEELFAFFQQCFYFFCWLLLLLLQKNTSCSSSLSSALEPLTAACRSEIQTWSFFLCFSLVQSHAFGFWIFLECIKHVEFWRLVLIYLHLLDFQESNSACSSWSRHWFCTFLEFSDVKFNINYVKTV